jgi:hypothetical protein
MNRADWIKEAGRKYLETIREEKPIFLGELQVTGEELSQLFLSIRQRHSAGDCDETRASLAVAAVQAAVQASDEDSSYVSVFFRYLGESENVAQWNCEYGPGILRFLVEHFEEVERPGAFKYVRPILNHAGISHRALPAFARFLTKLRDEAGPGYTRLDYARILKGVSSRFARNFLQEGPGYDFTREAMQTLERIERGIIAAEDCGQLPGFRRDFWPYLLESLKERASTAKNAGWFPFPLEHLELENRRLVLKFSEAGVLKRSYTLNGKLVQFPIEPIPQGRAVNGTILQRNGAVYNWRLETWQPGDGDWSLFRESDGAFVAASQPCEATTVAPGDYYILLAEGSSIPEQIVQEEGPYLDWTDRTGRVPLYRVWSVRLAPGGEWNDLALRTSGSSVPTLSFGPQRRNTLSAAGNVFQHQLPLIYVGNWSLEMSRLYALLVDTGNGPRSVGVDMKDSSLRIDAPSPCLGRVWVEPRGRVRNSIASLPSLEFAVLTEEFRWQVPEQMFSCSEQIPVRFQGTQKAEVIWNSPVIVVDRTSWRVKPPCRVAEGTVKLDSVEVAFSLRLPRCGVSVPGLRLGPTTLWLERLDQYEGLLVEALPRREARLHLKDGQDQWMMWSLGQMPDSGVRYCRTVEFRDSLLSSTLHAARLGVSVTGGQPVWLDCFVASAKRIREVMPLAAEECAGFELPGVGIVLKELSRAFDQKIDSLTLPAEVLTSPVGEYIADCAICIARLDGTRVDCDLRIDSFASAGVTGVLQWFEEYRLAGGRKSVPNSAEGASPDLSLIPIKRLREPLQLRLDEAQLWSDIAEAVRSWRKEVMSSTSLLVSPIASRRGGKDLTNAVRLYARAMATRNQKQFTAVIRELLLLSQSDCDGIVHAIGSAVHQLVLYNSGRLRDAAGFSVPQMPILLARLSAQMLDLAAYCGTGEGIGNWPDGVGLSDISPVEDDLRLESNLLRRPNS